MENIDDRSSTTPSTKTTNITTTTQSVSVLLRNMAIILRSFQEFSTRSGQNQEFFPQNINSQVKIRETGQTILVAQKYINNLSLVPETLFILLINEPNNEDNGDITFEGKGLSTQKSLINDINQAIESKTYKIAKALIESKKDTNASCLDIPLTFKFHPFAGSYWEPDDSYNFDISKKVAVKGESKGLNFSGWSLSPLVGAFDDSNLPEKVIVFAYLIFPQSNNAIFTIFGRLLMVPNSVIAEMKLAFNSNPPGVIQYDENTWQLLTSFDVIDKYNCIVNLGS